MKNQTNNPTVYFNRLVFSTQDLGNRWSMMLIASFNYVVQAKHDQPCQGQCSYKLQSHIYTEISFLNC